MRETYYFVLEILVNDFLMNEFLNEWLMNFGNALSYQLILGKAKLKTQYN